MFSGLLDETVVGLRLPVITPRGAKTIDQLATVMNIISSCRALKQLQMLRGGDSIDKGVATV